MQVRTDHHTSQSIVLKESFERVDRSLNNGMQRFFKLFQESTFEGSQAAALEMKKFAKRQSKYHQKFLLFHSLRFLARSDSDMLSWPNSPLLVLLQFVDPDVLSEDEDAPLQEGEMRFTPLQHVADLADPSDYSTHENQLILAKQLIEHGANVNAVSSPQYQTPLHSACHGDNVTNLDFVELLLEAGADPNAQDHLGNKPLIYTIPAAPGAAKFLLNWPTTDANITDRSGDSFLSSIRWLVITTLSNNVAFTDHPEWVHHELWLRQWRKIEVMLVERGAVDTGIITLE
jgi:hypothetical protein